MGVRCVCPRSLASLVLFAAIVVVVNSSHSNAAGLRSGSGRRELGMVICTADASFCPDGTLQTRDPSNDCELRPLCRDDAEAEFTRTIEGGEETIREADMVLNEAEKVLKSVGLTRNEHPGKNPNLRGGENTEPIALVSSAQIWGVDTEPAEATESPTQTPIEEDVDGEEILRSIEKADELIINIEEEMEEMDNRREGGQSEMNENRPPPQDPSTVPGRDEQNLVVDNHSHVEGHLKGHLGRSSAHPKEDVTARSTTRSAPTKEDVMARSSTPAKEEVTEADKERAENLVKEGAGVKELFNDVANTLLENMHTTVKDVEEPIAEDNAGDEDKEGTTTSEVKEAENSISEVKAEVKAELDSSTPTKEEVTEADKERAEILVKEGAGVSELYNDVANTLAQLENMHTTVKDVEEPIAEDNAGDEDKEGATTLEAKEAENSISEFKAELKAELDRDAVVEAEIKEKLETLRKKRLRKKRRKKRAAQRKNGKRGKKKKKKAWLQARGDNGS